MISGQFAGGGERNGSQASMGAERTLGGRIGGGALMAMADAVGKAMLKLLGETSK